MTSCFTYKVLSKSKSKAKCKKYYGFRTLETSRSLEFDKLTAAVDNNGVMSYDVLLHRCSCGHN